MLVSGPCFLLLVWYITVMVYILQSVSDSFFSDIVFVYLFAGGDRVAAHGHHWRRRGRRAPTPRIQTRKETPSTSYASRPWSAPCWSSLSTTIPMFSQIAAISEEQDSLWKDHAILLLWLNKNSWMQMLETYKLGGANATILTDVQQAPCN